MAHGSLQLPCLHATVQYKHSSINMYSIFKFEQGLEQSYAKVIYALFIWRALLNKKRIDHLSINVMDYNVCCLS